MKKKPVFNLVRCKGCGVCAAFCPKSVLKVIHGKITAVSGAQCIGCGMCENLCPDYAVWLVEEGGERVG